MNDIIRQWEVDGEGGLVGARFSVLTDGRIRVECDAGRWTLPLPDSFEAGGLVNTAAQMHARQLSTDRMIALLRANGVDPATVRADPAPEDHGDFVVVYHQLPPGAGWEPFPRRYPITVRPE